MAKKFLILFASLFLAVFVFANKVNAHDFDNYEDEDGNIQYGWHLETTVTDASTWYFNEDGTPKASYAAEGDTGSQFTNNYAIRNLAIGSADSYSLQTTFTPDPDSDLSVERAYGILLWYQNEDNFLIYWLMQKPNEWSGQFYGRVNGFYKKFYMTQETANLGNIGYHDGFRGMEFNDMWWDSLHAHEALRGNRASIVNSAVTLTVNSAVETITIGGAAVESRYFEIYQTVNDSPYLTAKFYVQDVNSTSGDFYTGLYSERFNVDFSNYSLTCDTDFAAPVNNAISALPAAISTNAEMLEVIKVASDYKSLLSFASGISADNKAKIEALDASVVPYVDNKILALDVNKTTFVDDVLGLVDLYESLPICYQDALTQVDALLEAIDQAENWEDPTLVKPVVTITTPGSAYAGDEIEVLYTVSDNLTAAEDLIIEVSVKKGPTSTVQLTNNKFVAAEGTYTIKVTAKDEHGNSGSATLQVQVSPKAVADTEKPVIAIQTADTAALGSEVEVKYSVTDNVSSGSDLEVLVSVVKDGAAVQLSNGKFTAEAGTYTITITAKDAAGNIATASKDVVVSSGDTTAPTVKITTPATASVGEEVLVTYTASDDTSAANKLTAVVKVEKDGAEVSVANNKFTAEAGTYTITVTVTDEAGNSSVATSTVTVAAAGNDQQSGGCMGSVVASIFGILTLGAMAFAFRRRKQD